VPSVESLTLDVENPSTGAKIAAIASAGAKDVDSAVAAAKAAFPAWRATQPQQRAKLLWKLADLVERDGDVISRLEALDVGLNTFNSKMLSVGQGAETLRYYAGWSDKITGKTITIPGGKAYTTREPIGVCAAIVPWNTPFLISIWKLAPALAVGNVVILKTPELAPLTGIKLAELVKEAGFPPGVVSVMTGLGKVAGAAISEHMEIRKVSFTGGAVTGRQILKAAANSNLKQVSLELGGKGPSIVFDDADLSNALFWTVMGFTAHNGQICVAGSRIYVQEGIYDAYLAAFKKQLAAAQTKGDPTVDGEHTSGPVISKVQHEKILSYIEKGKAEGGTVIGGGNKVGEKGYFLEATAFVDVKPDATIMKEEIFGPVTVSYLPSPKVICIFWATEKLIYHAPGYIQVQD
jgi:aldehyde dehydrogenase (NAD+)